MSALHELLARAEQNAAARAAEVTSIAKSREHLKEVEKAAIKDHRQALGLVTRIRGVIEAAAILPNEEPAAEATLAELGLRAGDEEKGEPVLVELPSPFTPALDYPKSQPVEPRVAAVAPEPAPAPKPAPRVVPLESTPSERSRPARPNAAGVRALADNVLAILESVRFGSTASIDLEVLYERTGKTKAAITAAIDDLAERGLIRKCRAAERGQLTVILKAVAA